jgi:hypothetical protein
MMINSVCPYCQNDILWSSTSETKYIRCCHCEKTFVPSTWGGGSKMPDPAHRRKKSAPPLWPWLLLTAAACVVVVVITQVYQAYQEKRALAHAPRVTRENFERLHVGMTDLEMVRLLGGHSRMDTSVVPKIDEHLAHRFTVEDQRFVRRLFWEDGDNVIWADCHYGKVLRFGAKLEGEQIGEDPTLPLSIETRIGDP